MTPYFEAPGVTLYLGKAEDVLPTLAAGSIDFIFTDPPYGHNNNNNGDLIARREAALGKGDYDAERDDRPIANDGPEANALIRTVLPEFRRLLSPGCCCCCCGGGGGPDPQFARWSLWIDEVLEFMQMVVWDKGPMGMGWHYRRSYETVLVSKVPGKATRWYDNSRRIENIIRPGDYGIRKIIPSAEQHPTEKPVELPLHFIGLHTLPSHLILDPFIGSGTTAVAALRLGRRCIGVDISAEYLDIAVERIERELAQPRLFAPEPEPQPEQGALFVEDER